MSPRGPGSRWHFRFARHPAVRASILTVTLVALGPISATTASASSSLPALTLSGSGSTFDAPFFDLAFAKYQKEHPGITISYAAVGSSAGIAAFSSKRTDFGASDVPMTAGEEAAATGGPAVQVPVDLGAEDVVYNLDLSAKHHLHLTGPVLAGIFLGQITNWDNPVIKALNPGIKVPKGHITVVHRSDGSGTTYIFSNYLSSVDQTWAAKVGTGKVLKWPVGEGAKGNGSVAATVFRTPFSIGYVETAYSLGLVLSVAAIRNQAGNYVVPTDKTISAAAAQKQNVTATNFSIVNQSGADSYPISGYSWALVYTHQPNEATGRALVNLLDWLTHAGQTYAAATSYVPLAPRIQQLAHTALQQVTGPTGAHLLG
jgi:phosphate transport system substrate-binding protein